MMANVLITIVTFCVMELVAWSAHRYLMHGRLWSWHRDHHDPKARQHSFFETNDRFFLVYGICYFLVHDVFIHQRFKWFRNSNWIYFRAIRKAHKVHHKHLSKEDGECFGMLWVSPKYFKEAAASQV